MELSRRDQFILSIINGFCANGRTGNGYAKAAIEMADELIKEIGNKPTSSDETPQERYGHRTPIQAIKDMQAALLLKYNLDPKMDVKLESKMYDRLAMEIIGPSYPQLDNFTLNTEFGPINIIRQSE